MSFQPVVPLTGYVGWRFLQRTLEAQQTAFTESQPVTRAVDYFRENIGKVASAEDLVADRRLLQVALGAFGLDEDIDNRFFIQTILEEGSTDREALANRLSDSRYAEFSRAFGFGDVLGQLTGFQTLMDDVAARYEDKQFAIAVGEQNNDMRLALSVESGLTDLLKANTTTDAQWFAVMGNPPLRKVFEAALGLPSSLARIDIDQQLETFKDRAQSQFGTDTVADFADPERQEDLIRLFLVRSEAANLSASSGASVALTLLQGAAQPL